MKKVLIIGMGKMGSAIFQALEKQEFDVVSCDRDGDVVACAAQADIVLIAVKPQSFDELAESLGDTLKEKIIISIMAGVSIASIQEKLHAEKVIRSMPNLAAAVGESATGWVHSDACSPEDLIMVGDVLASFGHQFQLESEDQMDAFSALAGSGPAYFFNLVALLEQKGIEFGFNQQQARRIAMHTFVGAAAAMEQSEKSPAQWVQDVASKGGMTEKALEHFEKTSFGNIFKDAVQKACDRSKQLG